MARRLIAYPVFALGSTMLWGLIEFVALLRARLQQPREPHHG